MSETGDFETGDFETGGFETGGILAEDESSEETGFAPAAGDRQADLWSDDIPVATDDLAAANELLEDTTPDFYESDDESDEFCEMISEDAGNPFADGYASESEDDSEPLEDVWMADEGEPDTGFASVVPDFQVQQRTESTASEDLVTAPVEPDDFEDPSAALLVDDIDFFDRPVNHAYEEESPSDGSPSSGGCGLVGALRSCPCQQPRARNPRRVGDPGRVNPRCLRRRILRVRVADIQCIGG
ncbi:MAG: hypothetical protein HC925_06130 [Coleofasciculaceae cyanobacterium SM2_3_26]|nr:hypothetical protein [Coleofasciculaceae cyanobacterium SM2_3_26]